VVEPGHAVRFTNPASGGGALTICGPNLTGCAGTVSRPSRTSASSVWQAFDGAGPVRLNGDEHLLERGDMGLRAGG
jgi:gentisate 1,2-dioxygenase